MSCNDSEINKDLIENFISITGTNIEKALYFLKISGSNLEVAVNTYLEAEEAPSISTSEEASSCNPTSLGNGQNTGEQAPPKETLGLPASFSNQIDEEEVRAPIPQKRAILVEDPYHALPYVRPKKITATSSVFDRCRDFKKETEDYEKQLNKKSSNSSTKSHMKRLHELFCPPVDILHQGDFQSARHASSISNRWLLVNIQNTVEFACQVLNRDVWSDKLVREIIAFNFILWQVYHDSDEGMHYETFYSVKSYPHLAVIDPRTGERIAVWENFGIKPSPDQFAELATIFLSDHSLNSSSESDKSNSKRSSNQENTLNKTSSIIDKSEEAQLEAALKASLDEHNETSTKQDFTYIESASDDSNSSCNSFSEQILSPKHKKRKISNQSKGISSSSMEESSPKKAQIIEQNGTSSSLVGGLSSSLVGGISSSLVGGTSSLVGRTSSCCSLVDDTSDKVTLLLRLPTNSRKPIIFGLDQSIEELKREVSLLGFPSIKYELIKSFPRTNISLLDGETTLRQAGFHKQETIFVQDR